MSIKHLYSDGDPRFKRMDEIMDRVYDLAISMNLTTIELVGYLEVWKFYRIEEVESKGGRST